MKKIHNFKQPHVQCLTLAPELIKKIKRNYKTGLNELLKAERKTGKKAKFCMKKNALLFMMRVENFNVLVS